MSIFIGIDYGAKRVGVAVSDKDGRVAFPRATFPNDRTLLRAVSDLVLREHATTVIIGESKNNSGEDNTIMARARRFANELERETGVSIRFEPEFYTSVQARHDTGKSIVDAEAAAIILNSYLTREAL